MRIALISETFLPKINGVTNTMCRLLEHLYIRGHQTIMFAPKGAPDFYAHTPIIQPISFPLPFYPELEVANPFANLDKYLQGFKPDIIHVVNPYSVGVAGTKYALKNDIPLVASYHTDVPGYTSQFYGLPFMTQIIWDYFRWIHNKADLTLCPSQCTLNELKEQGFTNLKIWSRGVDVAQYAPSKTDPTWRWTISEGHPEAPVLLYVGRLAAEKRVDWLLPVIKALPDVRLVIVGDGPMRSEWEPLFKGTNTFFTGYLQGEELARTYASSDLFVFPSANETFGNVVLEAMASGLPVVAPSSGGVIDSVLDGQTGFLFKPDSKEALIDSISKILNDRTLFYQMGSRARAVAKSRSWSGVLDHLIEDYASVISQHHYRLRKTNPAFAQQSTLVRRPFWMD